MSKLFDALEAIDDFRNAVLQQQDSEGPLSSAVSQLGLRNVLGQLHSPLRNIHATGVGIRSKGRSLLPEEIVIKVYVYRKLPELGGLIPRILSRPFHGIEIDIEELPILVAGAKAQSNPQSHQARVHPIVGGVQIQLQGADHFGTLGGFVRSAIPSADSSIFALSNAHVLGKANEMSLNHAVVQPGSNPGGVSFASVSRFSAMSFFENANNVTSICTVDAAIARISDTSMIQTGAIFGVPNYAPQPGSPVPGMSVTKSGRTTGVTNGVVKSVQVNGLTVNYGNPLFPLYAKFDGVVGISGDNGSKFGTGGDSGSFVLESSSGRPVGLLFAASDDSAAVYDTFACDFHEVCQQLQVTPV